jgi:hypothetical protein
VWWKEGGTTDLDNLVLVCFFHHKLVHEHGWSLHRHEGGSLDWRKPDGSSYVPIPALRRRARLPALVPVGPPPPP